MPHGTSKAFFFEKKRQKTFMTFGIVAGPRRTKRSKKFFGSFFQKRTFCLPLGAGYARRAG
jgi:hypothetical protein